MFSKISDRDSLGYPNLYENAEGAGIRQVDRVLLLHLDTDFTDSSPASITVEKTATITTTDPKFGAGCMVTTTSQYMRPPPSDSNYFIGSNNGDYTLDFWLKPLTTGGLDYIMVGANDTTATGDLVMLYQATGTMSMRQWNIGEDITSAGSVPVNTWTHIALEQEGIYNRLYCGGVLEVEKTYTIKNDAKWQLGRQSFSEALNAQWDEVAFVRTAKYRGNNFTPQTVPYT